VRIYDLEQLPKLSDNTYDLTQLTFEEIEGVVFKEYVVQKGEEMRIDLVCQSIFGNVDYVDLICSLNKIENPLNIQEGAILRYPLTSLELFRIQPKDQLEINTLLNPNKVSRKDVSRSDYNDNSQSLPPTILPSGTNQFNIEGDFLILGDNLF
jgi:hypothetical protein